MVAGAAAITPVDEEDDDEHEVTYPWDEKQQRALLDLQDLIRARKKEPLQHGLKLCKALQLYDEHVVADAEELLAVIQMEENAAKNELKLINKEKVKEAAAGKVFNPQSPWLQNWDYAMCLCLVFTATVTPFEVGFLETKLDPLFFFNRIIDCFFAVDIYINFNLSYKDEEQAKWITDVSQVRRHYLFGWAFMDIISTIPYDCISLFLKSDSMSNLKVMRLLKLLKLVKLLRVLRSARIFKRLQTELSITNSTSQLIKFLCIIFAVIHWIACLWRMVPDMEDDEGGWVNNLVASGDMKATVCKLEDSFEVCHPTAGALYLRGVEFSLMIMVMGYSTAKPDTDLERVVAILCMIVAGSAYAYVIGAVCSVVSERDPASIQYQQTMDLLRSFMDENKLPMALRFKMQGYFEHIKSLFRDQHHKQEILECMTPELQQEVALLSQSDWIGKPANRCDMTASEASVLLSGWLCFGLRFVCTTPAHTACT
jgi:hypothetical protein